MSDEANDTYGLEVKLPTWARRMSIDFRGDPEPKPEPAWHKSPWKSDGVPAAFHEAHFNATQRWSVFGIPDDIQAPYGAEVKTKDRRFWTGEPFKSTFRLPLEMAPVLADALDRPSILPTWLLVDAEEPRTKYTWQVVDWLRENYPEIQLGSGPIPWVGPLPDDLKRFGVTATFRNFGSDDAPGYWGRMGEDAARWVTRSKALGTPFSVFPQPVMKHPAPDGSTRIHLVSIEDYKIALDIGRRSPWGLFMWGVPEVVGLRETDPDGVAAIMAAWDAAEHDTTERPVVYIAAQKNWRIETVLCAIAYHAGYDAEYYPGWPLQETDDWRFYRAGGDSIMLDFPPVVVDGKEYPWWQLFVPWFDIGHPTRDKYANAFLRKLMRGYQQARAVQLREKLQ